MNIFDILRKLGYDVLSFDESGVYTVCLTGERRKRELTKIEKGEMSYIDGFDPYSRIRVKVEDVCFNQLGDLYVSFCNADDETDNIDCYEYRNMPADELFE